MSIIEDIGFNAISRLINTFRAVKAESLIDYTAVSRVEPIVIIDNDCIHTEIVNNVMQSLLTMFAGYYLQAFNISVNIGKINVRGKLDSLNPNRNPLNSIDSNNYWLSLESYNDKLPLLNTDAIGNDNDAITTTSQKENLVTIKDLSNLSVGKLINVDVTDGDNKGTITLSVRLMANNIPTEALINLLSEDNNKKNAKERYYAWKAGRLKFIKDIVFCADLIESHKKKMLSDKTGLYADILKRRKDNKLSTLVSGNPSLATASNMVVVSKDTLEEIERVNVMKFSNFSDREKIFKETSLMIIAVIDKKWDMVTFYHRGISESSTISDKAMTVGNKNNGPDITQILKAYQMGSAPLI